ncbi:tRNA (adenosine(37)-N6)-dimethylallyltransferase MiaA [Aestuariivirga sp.]|uniref:tRNA (adenosine(37)-N6)-dimethylallyltransferase MiaA n=1 Tax=Aestuariivirga sp. TaxID=2650926 RepID=UPI0039E52BD6
MMANSSGKRALLIAGPTASGKSALALARARAEGGVIVNADALQVYRELRILSARPSHGEEMEMPHRLYGHVSGREAYSVAQWLADASRVMGEIWRDGGLPILVGGTGLYFRAIEKGLADVPPVNPAIRKGWRDFTGDLHAELQRRDPAMAARLHPSDRQRLARALEVIEGTGRSLLAWQEEGEANALLQGVRVERILVDVPRIELYARAESRFDAMMAAGALDEVRPLLAFDSALPMMRAIGVPELSACLRGDITPDEAVSRAKQATRNYIKRQLTWWRGQGHDWSGNGPSPHAGT